MADKKPISQAAQRFVDRKLEQLERKAQIGCGLYYELYSQNFTDSVDALAARVKRADLREHILSQAEKAGAYFGGEAQKGRWVYDVEAGDIQWQARAQESAAAKYGGPRDSFRCELPPPSRSR